MKGGWKETQSVQRPISARSPVSESRMASLNLFEPKRKKAPLGTSSRVCNVQVAEGTGLVANPLRRQCQSLRILSKRRGKKSFHKHQSVGKRSYRQQIGRPHEQVIVLQVSKTEAAIIARLGFIMTTAVTARDVPILLEAQRLGTCPTNQRTAVAAILKVLFARESELETRADTVANALRIKKTRTADTST